MNHVFRIENGWLGSAVGTEVVCAAKTAEQRSRTNDEGLSVNLLIELRIGRRIELGMERASMRKKTRGEGELFARTGAGRRPHDLLAAELSAEFHGSAPGGMSRVRDCGTTSIVTGREPSTSPSASTNMVSREPFRGQHSTASVLSS
jgi:hypothetical protein